MGILEMSLPGQRRTNDYSQNPPLSAVAPIADMWRRTPIGIRLPLYASTGDLPFILRPRFTSELADAGVVLLACVLTACC